MDSLVTFDSESFSHASPMINYRKDAKKGIKFKFMVVGEPGTGKTTFINSLLGKKVMSHRYEAEGDSIGETKTLAFTSAKSVALPSTSILTKNDFDPSIANEEPGIALTETKIEILDEENTKILLTIVDTPGFGENFNNEICFTEIENYLRQQFDQVLAEETRIKRTPRFVDTRVHALLYFITPTGHGLRELDISCMKRLSKYVNIIPVISKADSFTSKELRHFKQQIRIDIEKFNVPTFRFDNSLDDYDEEDDYDLIQECRFLSKLQPFAIVSSEDEFEVRDKNTGQTRTIRARQYPWGLVDINNTKYSDFAILKSVLLGSHLQDLKDLTHDFLYETYRTERLMKVTGGEQNEDEDEEEEFHESLEHQNGPFKENHEIPSLSNLAQLTASTSRGDTASVSSSSSKKPKSMLLEDSEAADMDASKLKDTSSFMSSTSTISLEGKNGTSHSSHQSNAAFKRLSIAPQRNQLRQISETVPYVIRHERILERQQKLEEMEIASAKELANRAAMLEKKAALLKAKERMLMKRTESVRHDSDTSNSNGSANVEAIPDSSTSQDPESTLKKEETLTDLHSIISSS
ncbi:uncharacterized protein PRCAT00000069001 [Priceomyces carsonii]|uniref:uncharacterized protein n=1 Tax=Priceomyces carsonii TaxID=28549 RepID=UPI002EDB2722|nr:unnamed protein product [Priceomyces carsonii]